MGPPHQPRPEPTDQSEAAAVIGEGQQQQVKGIVIKHRGAAAPLQRSRQRSSAEPLAGLPVTVTIEVGVPLAE